MILKSAQTAKIGKKFKNARELLGLSENEVSMETFMRTDFIQAIESGDYSIFPARIFALSYFKKYATFLGIQVIFFDIYDVKNLPPDEATKKPKSVIKELNSIVAKDGFELEIFEIENPDTASEILRKLKFTNFSEQNYVSPLVDLEYIGNSGKISNPNQVEYFFLASLDNEIEQILITQGHNQNLGPSIMEPCEDDVDAEL